MGFVLILTGLFIVVISQKMAKVITIDKESKALETGLRFFIPIFGFFFIVIGLLIVFDLVQTITSVPNDDTRAYLFIVLGTISIISSPFFVKKTFNKYLDKKQILEIGKNELYIFYIGSGLIALTAGILDLAKLL